MKREDFKKLIFGDKIIVHAIDHIDNLLKLTSHLKEVATVTINAIVIDFDGDNICFVYLPLLKELNNSHLWSETKGLTNKDECCNQLNLILPKDWEETHRFRWTGLEWAIDFDKDQKIISAKYSCIRCNDSNKWAESNLPNDKFMCFSCRDSNKWLYNDYLNGERN